MILSVLFWDFIFDIRVAKISQQLEENLHAGHGVIFSCTLEAEPYHGSGDKIKLPPSSFVELNERGAFDKGPLQISLPSLREEGAGKEQYRMTHAGLMEFTEEESSVALPPHTWSNLFPARTLKSSMVEVRYVWLPKGTYAKLFSDIPEHKAVLETSLQCWEI
ncbi:unnamed protein product [Fraxinus pennsylvanica]|uniref:Ubiquitin fusion degradation protein UFD1 N-terminal subdomain 1 domain-containing protein n=1 Tax=Fraxinus pennsylvanica TaxID=56036 RepID=A0AAD1YR63_9LAMI|nr:unnamed protein product [Fraxinus pennsylvanica]